MQRLSSAIGLSIQWWRKLFDCFVLPFSMHNFQFKKKSFQTLAGVGLAQACPNKNHAKVILY